MSEQTLQDDLYSIPVSILDKYTCWSLGATTIKDLVDTGKIIGVSPSVNAGKKPDVLIVDKVLFSTLNDAPFFTLNSVITA